MSGRTLGRAERLRAIEQLLYRRVAGVRAEELAEHCSVHRSTIYRDLVTLSAAGVPIWREGSTWHLDRGRYLTHVRLTLDEATALFISARLLSRHSDQCNPHVVSALDKLATALPQPMGEHVERAARCVRDRPVNPCYVQVLEGITRAWSEQLRAEIAYRSPRSGQLRVHKFDVYYLEPSAVGYACYVIGYDHWAKDLRTFKLERLESVRLLDEQFEIPADFDADEHLSSGWGIMVSKELQEVALRFSPSVTGRVKESIWHQSQQIEDADDGGCILRIQVSMPMEMKPWIRGWGPECEVLAPAWLREEVGEGDVPGRGVVQVVDPYDQRWMQMA